ncbi:serine/threonine-protein kinase Nek1 [Plasmodium cynomolgi strain B]|uniref:Serine/threonine-protein kinase Nek1 n=1 Tax=Plasmodium cynomolgi (strain B) TaxID=1120755 RepID=K6UZS6_PLACD|nr:serine/threonine-protein kinase Nek1 [Plasmodium cynomolgi strain B]GAB68230.1 serine/threonine-protein kinase Nek1 [Plasmodium cynomolgi strain B]
MLSLLLPSISNTDEKQSVYMNYGYKFETVLDTLTSNSEIHLIRSLETGEAFISKVYDIYGASENDLNRYMNELHIMQKLENCENIVQVVDFIKQNDSLSLIIEFCSQGDLYTHISRRKMNNEMYTESEIFNIFNQILNGLNSIHKNGITHGDLKSTNIFIKDDKIKIGDFGISQKGSNNNLGTLNFLNKNYKNYIVKDISNIYSDKLVNIISKLLSLNTLERLEAITNYNLSRTESINLEVSNNANYVIA